MICDKVCICEIETIWYETCLPFKRLHNH
uniref:Uncharacterized protein n=1 Tax=Rhizophora mucronata TaxID=61149 RepID=A0A2P2LP31_RHIMU